MNAPQCLFVLELETPADHTCRRHTHGCTEIVWCIEGRGRLYQDGREYPYDAGDLCLYQPGGEHWITQRTRGRQFCLGVAGYGAETLAPGVRPLSEEARLRFEEIRARQGEDGPTARARLDLLSGLVCLALRAEEPNAETTPVARAKGILDTRFDEPLSVREVARSVFVSPDYLRQLFRETFGESPLHYLIRRRMDHARELLERTDLPVQEVALRCGLENPYYFSRLFKKTVGVSPSRYRRTGGQAGG